MATGGYDASQEYASDIVEDDLKEKMCATCIKKCTFTDTSAITEIRISLLCGQCRDFVFRHQFNSHEIIVVKKQDSAETGFDMNGLDKCIQHMKKVKFYCEDHNQVCCSGCVTTHRKCDKFSELSALSEEKEAYREVYNDLLKINDESISMKQEMRQLEVELNETGAYFSSEIDEIKNKLLKLLDKDKCVILIESESISAEKKLLIEQRKVELEIIETDVSQGLQLLSRTLKNGTPSQKFIVGRAVSETLRRARSVIEYQKQRPMSITAHLSFSNELTQLLRTEENNVRLYTDETCDSQGGRSPLFVDEQPLSEAMSVKLRDNNPNIADLSDDFRPTKLQEMLSELFDNEWTSAWTVLSEELTERSAVEFLLDVFLLAYEYCSSKLKESWQFVCKWYIDEHTNTTLRKQLTDARKAKVSRLSGDIAREFLRYINTVCTDENVKGMLSGPFVNHYISKSVRIALLMCACDPPVVVACPGLADRPVYQKNTIVTKRRSRDFVNALTCQGKAFDRGLYREYTAKGPRLEFYVWPVVYLHDGGPILAKGIAQGTTSDIETNAKSMWSWRTPLPFMSVKVLPSGVVRSGKPKYEKETPPVRYDDPKTKRERSF